MRLIDADEFDRELYAEQMKHENDKWVYGYKLFEAIRIDLRNRPTIDAVPVVHGRWKPTKIGWSIYPSLGSRCSECWYTTIRKTDEWHYCPNCGAKMDGGTANDEG